MSAYLCKKCHDWRECKHSKFRRTICSLCWQEDVLCVECNEENPLPAPTAASQLPSQNNHNRDLLAPTGK